MKKSLAASLLALGMMGCGSDTNVANLFPRNNVPVLQGTTRLKEPGATVNVAVGGTVLKVGLNQLLVAVSEFASEADLAAIDNAIDGFNGEVVGEAPGAFIIEVEFPAGTDLVAVQNALEQIAGIDEVTFNQEIDLAQAPVAPNPATFQGDYWVNHINAPTAWARLNLANTGVPIGIIDSGYDASANTLAPGRLLGSIDSIGTTLPADSDAGRHGTPVGAFAAGDGSANSTLSTVGTSWNSPVLQVKATSTPQKGYVFSGIVGAETALNRGCRWLNLSFGPAAPENPTSEEAFYIPEREFRSGYTNLLELAAERDAVLVFASGNDGAGANGFQPKNDNRFLPLNSQESDRAWRTHAMVIGATDINKNVASFSREGEVLSMAAPGDSVGVGKTIQTVDVHSGCSYAAPLTCGSGAALLNVNPDLMAVEARQLLIESTSDTIVQKVRPLRMLDFGAAATRAAQLRNLSRSALRSFDLGTGQTLNDTVQVTVPQGGGAANVSLDVIGDAQGFFTVSPTSFTAVPAGEARTFNLVLSRANSRPATRARSFPMMLWVRINGNVTERIPVRVNVPEES